MQAAHAVRKPKPALHMLDPSLIELLKVNLVNDYSSHIVSDLLRLRYALNCGVRTFCYVLFALMQKEPKKSRAKYASPRMPLRHPAFGSGHRAPLLNFGFNN